MKEHPMLFSGDMVRAILLGNKTQTRRIVNPQPTLVTRAGTPIFHDPWNRRLSPKCPYGQPGDFLWVRETHAFVPETAYRCSSNIYQKINPHDIHQSCIYRASFDRSCSDIRWRPSIHMPRWASRLTLEIVDVRMERLQAGAHEAAFDSRYLAEGIHRIHHGRGDYYYSAFRSEPHPNNWLDPFDAWRELWERINGAESWEANPWVWVIEFRRLPA